MLSYEEQYRRLTEVYSVKCPKCGAQWHFEMTSQNGWKEVRTCGCTEYRKLIDQRLNEHFPLHGQ